MDNANEANQIIVVKDKENEFRLRVINIILSYHMNYTPLILRIKLSYFSIILISLGQ